MDSKELLKLLIERGIVFIKRDCDYYEEHICIEIYKKSVSKEEWEELLKLLWKN